MSKIKDPPAGRIEYQYLTGPGGSLRFSVTTAFVFRTLMFFNGFPSAISETNEYRNFMI